MNNRNLSKFLSKLLRHQPELLKLNMDKNGWVDLDELIEKLNTKGRSVNKADIAEVVANNNKQRFKLDEANNRIRANQGHSIRVDVELVVQAPPHYLYHGTARKNEAIIRKEGLRKMNRQHVHLSEVYATAIEVGRRHGAPIVLKVNAYQMEKDGFQFYLSENKVWLTDVVAPRYIEIDQ